MPRLLNYLTLARISNLPTVWTNVLAAVVLSTPLHEVGLSIFLLAAANSAFYAAGMCLNDLLDVEADRHSKPFRPLPSGTVSAREAATLIVGLFAFGMLLLAFVPHRAALWPGLLLVVVIVAYDALHQRHSWSVLLMAACRFLVFAVSSYGIVGTFRPGALLGGGLQFAYVLLLTGVARYEKGREFSFPLIPLMIAGISMLDGFLMAVMVAPAWLLAGLAGSALTWWANRWVRGD